MKSFWYRGHNFGDVLTPWLFKKITGSFPDYSTGAETEPVFMVTGSILSHPVRGSVVWGCGFAWCNEPPQQHSKVCAVRGPLSRNKLRIYGLDCPDVFGDPAILMPRWLAPETVKSGKIAIIPHVIDYAEAIQAYGSLDFVSVIDLNAPVEEVVWQLTKCHLAISSSLHGLIVAHAYGIPALWVKFSDRVLGCGFKFHDYFASGGLPLVNAVNLTGFPPIGPEIESQISRQLPVIDAEKLWQACPFKP